ncbi:MAG: hypothetical protein HC902_06650, partial [Calothrix sp. SM1_5_4]|nr:hypothetical protein [Calothrix sp. SM1_5_4]
GLELIRRIPSSPSREDLARTILNILRDKGRDSAGQPLPLGNRRAIDALIATHSVIYDAPAGVLYVGRGPAVSGPFAGYDLKASFRERRPVPMGTLPADPEVSADTFDSFKDSAKKISAAHRLARQGACAEALKILTEIPPRFQQQSPYQHALGDAWSCLHDDEKARHAWTRALALVPAYARAEAELKRKLR